MRNKYFILLANVIAISAAWADVRIDVSDRSEKQIQLEQGSNNITLVNFTPKMNTYCSMLRGAYKVVSITEMGPDSRLVSFDKDAGPVVAGFDFTVGAVTDAGKTVVLEVSADGQTTIAMHCEHYSSDTVIPHDEYLQVLGGVDEIWDSQYGESEVYQKLERLARAAALIKATDDAGLNTQSKASALIAGELAKLIFDVGAQVYIMGDMNVDLETYYKGHKNEFLAPFRAFFKNVVTILKAHKLRASEKPFFQEEFKDLMDTPRFEGESIRKMLVRIKAGVMQNQVKFIENQMK